MNRKIAVAAIVGGLMHTVSLLRGQEVQRTPTRLRTQTGELLPAPRDTATLSPSVVEDLQRQINALAARVDALTQAQAGSVGFTKVGNDLILAPLTGNVTIKAPMNLAMEGAANLTIKGSSNVSLEAGATMTQRASMIRIN
jgi:hypothetical protein